MKKLKFSRDNGTDFYRELNDRLEAYFAENRIERTGNKIMFFKMFLYFSLDALFYGLMITSTSAQ